MTIMITGLVCTGLLLLFFFVRIAAFSNAQFDTLAEDALIAQALPGMHDLNQAQQATQTHPTGTASPEKEYTIAVV